MTKAIADYVKIIYKLQEDQQKVTTSDIARRMNISAASVTSMIKKLSDRNLVRYVPYYGVQLSEAGKKMALKLIRNHRLLELYLTKVLGLSWDKVDAEAERLEHVVSDELMDKINEALGGPKFDPHGSPIPTHEGIIEQITYDCLYSFKPRQSAVICRIKDGNPEMLQYLGYLGLVPNITVEVIEKAPFNGPLIVRIGSVEHAIGMELATRILAVPCQRKGVSNNNSVDILKSM